MTYRITMKILEIIFSFIIVFVLVACASMSEPPQKPPLGPVTGQVPKTIGLLWWPADPSKSFYPFADDIDECLTDILADKCPGFEIMHQQKIRDSLFPLMEIGTQPTTEESFVALLTRVDVRKRLIDKGLRYLVTFTGGTDRDPGGFIICPYGCIGFMWINKDTRIDGFIWELKKEDQAEHIESSAKGTTIIPAYLLPVPIPAPTISKACDGFAQRITDYIRLRSGNAECR